MPKEAGVVKSISGGIVRALNDLTGEVRQLSIGDIIYQNEKIITDSSDSKVTITQTDGKDITLIGKDTLTLDQDSNNNKTVADVSALQQAILSGTDLNALEETAAGGPQAGGNGGDGVSLSSASFTEGGHISNIYANVEAIDALALAAGGDNSFGVSGGNDLLKDTAPTPEPQPQPEPTPKPRTALNISAAQDVSEGGVMTYDLSLPTALTARPTTLNLNFSGGVAGKDYDANSIEYSVDGGSHWTTGTIVNLADANQINNVKVRVKTIDNYGLKDVDLANNPTAMGVNQNQGEQDGSKYSNLNGVEYGVYKRNLTLSVTTDNDEVANSQANGKIIDNDDYININGNSQTDHEKIDTKEGDDTVNITGTLNGTDVFTGNGDDIVKINNTIGNNARFFTGDFGRQSDNDIVEINNSNLTRIDYTGGIINTGFRGNDTIAIKSSTIKGVTSPFYISPSDTGMNDVTVDKYSTLENVHIENQGGGTVDLSGNLKNVRVSVTNTDLYNNGTNHEYKSVVNIHNNMTGDSIDADYSSIMTGHGTDHINIDEGVTIDRVQFQMNAGDDTLDLKEGVTFKGGNIYLGSVDPSVFYSRFPGMPTPNFPAFTDNDTLNVKAGATLENSKISTQDGTDTINIEKGSTVDNNTIGMGKGIDTININGNVSGMTVKMGEDKDTVNIGEGVKVKDSEFYGDSDWYYGSNNGWKNPKGSKDTFNINKDAELENVTIYGDAKSDEYNTYLSNASYNRIKEIVSGDDDINIGEGAKLKNVTIYGDSNFADPVMNNNMRNYSNIEIKGGNDTINITKGTNLDNVKIYGETGDDTITIAKDTKLINNTTIDGGAGYDTLKIADDSVDLTKVKNIEKLDLTEGNHNMILSAKDVLDMTDSNNKLRIDGDNNDNITLQGRWDKASTPNDEGYYIYTKTEESHTITLEIKDTAVQIDL
nr:retention module-containing protein [uncultured Campylobacter sp.]